ncbi:MAG: DUF305 domain-containing protein [Chloroflexota bacterium]|nr:DUF305 domain-containing protein [Chloroflexota bacterium]
MVAGIVILLLASAVGFFIGQMTASWPDEDSAEAGFARDMATHHEQAVEMALLVTDRSTNPRMLGLARDIAFTQQHQIGQMRGWLDQWGLPASGLNDPMTWMGHPTNGLMPGMATEDELAALQEAIGPEAERLFLTLMIRHHEGALPMALAIRDRSENEAVRRLARSIQTSQQAEVELMRSLLDQIPTEAESTPPATPAARSHQHPAT